MAVRSRSVGGTAPRTVWCRVVGPLPTGSRSPAAQSPIEGEHNLVRGLQPQQQPAIVIELVGGDWVDPEPDGIQVRFAEGLPDHMAVYLLRYAEHLIFQAQMNTVADTHMEEAEDDEGEDRE